MDLQSAVFQTLGVGNEKKATAYCLKQKECFINAVSAKEQTFYPSVAEGTERHKIVDAVLNFAEEHTIIYLQY